MTSHHLRQLALLAFGFLLVIAVTWFMRGRDKPSGGTGQIWTCSMHPQIRMDHPDVCPICGMDLTPIQSNGGDEAATDADELVLSERGRQMAGLESVELVKQPLFKELRTVGKVEFDETALVYVTARITGRVEEVFASFPGTAVKQGDHLVSIYSPDLLATQSEFLDAVRRDQEQRGRSGGIGGSLLGSARRRLELWGITAAQIEELLRTGKAEDHLVIYAPFGGTIVEKNVRPGQYVETGEMLYRLVDLGRVWLILEVFETDVAWVRFGQPVQVTLEGIPEQAMTGSVAFIEPVLNEDTRTVRVRVVLPNPKGRLKPGMYAHALLRIPIQSDGRPGPTGLEGKFACPMHPYVVQDVAGSCAVCRMPLDAMPIVESSDIELETLAVPADAVLTTGRRQLVYVDHGEGRYELVAPHLGPRAGDYYPVLHGLSLGDRVVRRGNFLLDSQFQISGKPSLMYPDAMHGGHAGGHQHGDAGADRPGRATTKDAKIAANLQKLPEPDRVLAMAQRTCPITREPLGSMGVPLRVELEGRPVYLCCAACKDEALQRAGEIVRGLDAKAADAPPHQAHPHHAGEH